MLDYYNQIRISFENLFNDITVNNSIKGKILELITCIKFNCLMYNDVLPSFKKQYNLSFTDDGIDCIDINKKYLYQVKFYKKFSKINDHILGTFFKYAHNLPEFKSFVVSSQDCKFDKRKFNNMNYVSINDNEILDMIYKSYINYYFNFEEFYDFNFLNFNNYNLSKLNTFYNDDNKIKIYNEIDNINFEINYENPFMINNKIKLDDKYYYDNYYEGIELNFVFNKLKEEIKEIFKLMIDNKKINTNKLIENKNVILNSFEKIPMYKKIKLYNHQKEVLYLMNSTNELNNYYQLCCGSGKTYIFLTFISEHLDKKHLILVPNILLAQQIDKQLREIYNINNNNLVYTNTNKNFNNGNIYICVYNSFSYINLNEFDFIYIDEAHHILKHAININEEFELDKKETSNNKKIYNQLELTNAKKFYFSATISFINNLNYVYSIDNAIKDKIICDFNINIHYVNNNDIKNIIKVLKKHSEYQRILIYGNTIDKIKELSKIFNDNNIKSNYLDSKFSLNERLRIINQLKTNEIRVLFSVNTLSEGIDIKMVDSCIFYDNRNSSIQIIQCLGRILRKYENKKIANLIFLTNNINECPYNKYIDKLNNYCNKFIEMKNNNKNIFNCIKFNNDRNKVIDNDKEDDTNNFIDDDEFNDIIYKNIISNLKENNFIGNNIKHIFPLKTKENKKDKIKKDLEVFKTQVNNNNLFIDKILNDNSIKDLLKKQNEEINKLNQRIKTIEEQNLSITTTNLKIKDDTKIKVCYKYYLIHKSKPKRDVVINTSDGLFKIGLYVNDQIKKIKNKQLQEIINNIFIGKYKLNENDIKNITYAELKMERPKKQKEKIIDVKPIEGNSIREII